MKLTFVFLIVSGIIFHLKFSEQKQSLVPEAIHQVIEQHFVKNSLKFEIFYNSDNSDVLRKTLKLIKELKDYRITELDDDDKSEIILGYSGIFIFDTLENFEKLMNRLRFIERGPRENNMLVYCQDSASARVGELKFMTGMSYLIEKNAEISLKTLSYFTTVRCRKYQKIDVNKFSRKSMRWSGSTFFLTMIRDFHGCPLYFGVRPETFGWDVVDIPFAELFHALARHLNFEFEQVSAQQGEQSEKVDHYVRSVTQGCTFSSPLFSSPFVVAVPPGAPYTPIETFFLPFDLETWILFSLVFILAFAMVVVVKLSRSRSLRVMIIGENVTMPGLNIFGIFMGIGMLSLPIRNISRILLMNFILFSLIMRTAYQGKYFEFMTSEPNKRPIQTVAELIEKNFTLFVPKHSGFGEKKDLFNDNLGRLNYTEVDPLELSMLRENVQDPHFKGCILTTLRYFKTHEVYSVENGTTPLKFNLLQTEFGSNNFGVCFKPFSFMSPIFTLKIEQLLTAGIFEKMESRLKHLSEIPAKKSPPKPYDTVLTLQHLSIGFYIWLLMILLSCLAFTGEMLKYWGPKVVRMLFFHYILSSFYKMQRSMH